MNSEVLYIVGGGAGLIGRCIAEGFANKKSQVISIDKSATEKKPDRYTFYQADLSDEAVVGDVFKKTFSNQSYQHAVLINTQGIANPNSGPIAELSLDHWQKYLDINLTSYFLCCREFIRHKEKFKTGSIVNLSSTRHCMAEENTEAYCAAKGGIVSLTQALSISLSNTDIRVNSISPGWIDDPEKEHPEKSHRQHPSGRIGKPIDIFKACEYLTDPEQVFVTGQDLVIDGGMTKKMIYK